MDRALYARSRNCKVVVVLSPAYTLLLFAQLLPAFFEQILCCSGSDAGLLRKSATSIKLLNEVI